MSFIVVGGYDWELRTKFFDAGVPEAQKKHRYLDLFFQPVNGGQAYLEVYCDFDETNVFLYRPVLMTNGWESISLEDFKARFIQIRLRGFGFVQPFKLHSYNIRWDPDTMGVREEA